MGSLKYSKKYLITIHIAAIIWTMVCIFPILFSLSSSFKNNTEIFNAPFALPQSFAMGVENYLFAIERAQMFRGMFNSFVYASLATAATIALALPVAYALTRMRLPFADAIMMYFVLGLTLPVHATLVTLSVIVRDLGLRNTYMGIILVYIATGFSFAIFVLSNFVKGVSYEMDEAALIDGCGVLRLVFRIIMPLSAPAIVTVCIVNFLRVYNDLIFSVVLLTQESMMTVSISLMRFRGDMVVNYGGTFAGIILAIAPLITFYTIFQKRIEQGLSEGSVKG
jgi:raffinose/stachyose/melibiose transport system permease protein